VLSRGSGPVGRLLSTTARWPCEVRGRWFGCRKQCSSHRGRSGPTTRACPLTQRGRQRAAMSRRYAETCASRCGSGFDLGVVVGHPLRSFAPTDIQAGQRDHGRGVGAVKRQPVIVVAENGRRLLLVVLAGRDRHRVRRIMVCRVDGVEMRVWREGAAGAEAGAVSAGERAGLYSR